MEDANLLIKYDGVDIYQQELVILRRVNLEVRKGEFLYLIGKVGSGKSSLLKTFYAEVPIHSGDAQVFEYDLKKLKNSQVPHLRRRLGIIYQDFQLLIDRTIFDNLYFVLKATGWTKREEMDERISDVLRQVGMTNKGYKMPHQLSGGEQQRVVIARAMLNSPDIILADEPTGHLDPETGKEIVELLHAIKDQGTTVVMSTHNLKWVDEYPGRLLRFEDEQLKEIK